MDEAALLSVDVTRSSAPRAVIAAVTGELDFGTTSRLVSALGDAPAEGCDVILDLAGLTFCDSTALGTLVALHKRVAEHGGRLFLTAVGRPVLDAITVTSLDRLLRIRPSVQAVNRELAA